MSTHRHGLSRDSRRVHMRAALEHYSITGQQLPRPQQEIVAHFHQLGRHIVHRAIHHPMSHTWGGCFQLSHRLRGPPLGIPLECLAASLHEDHKQTRERLPKDQGGDDGKHRHEICGEAAPRDAAQGPPHDWEAGECQPRAPQQGRDARPPRYMDEQPGQNEEESASRKEVETAQRTAG